MPYIQPKQLLNSKTIHAYFAQFIEIIVDTKAERERQERERWVYPINSIQISACKHWQTYSCERENVHAHMCKWTIQIVSVHCFDGKSEFQMVDSILFASRSLGGRTAERTVSMKHEHGKTAIVTIQWGNSWQVLHLKRIINLPVRFITNLA